MKMLVAYYSACGNTEKMARLVAEGARGLGLDVDVLPVDKVDAPKLKEYAAIVIGSPAYYGTMAAQVKTLLDSTAEIHGMLAGKVGGAFSISYHAGGGNETTVLDILRAMLVHGMIVVGDPGGDHYGPVAIQTVDARAEKMCRALGIRIGELASRLAIAARPSGS